MILPNCALEEFHLDATINNERIKLLIEMNEKPSLIKGKNNQIEQYFVRATYLQSKISELTITRIKELEKEDSFYMDYSTNPPIPKPYVSDRLTSNFFTSESFRGQNINLNLTLLANSFYRQIFNSSLYSDIVFGSFGITASGEELRPGKLVWKKLEKMNVARYEPYLNIDGKLVDRWKMI